MKIRYIDVTSADADSILEIPAINKKRKKLSKIQKLFFDEFIYYHGMAQFAKYQ